MENSVISSIKKLKKYLKQFYFLILLNIVISAISGIIGGGPIILIKRLFDSGVVGRNEKDVLYSSLGVILLAVIGSLTLYFNNVLSGKISTSVYKNIIDDLYDKVLALDIEYFSGSQTGDIMTRFTNDAMQVNLIITNLFTLIKNVIMVIFCFGYALYVDWKLTMGVVIIAPVIIHVTKKYSKKLRNTGKNRQETSGALNSKLQETVSGIRVIKAFSTERIEKSKFKNLSSKLKLYTRKSVRYDAISSSISEAMNYIIMALVLLFGGYRVIRSESFTPGDFITIAAAISTLYSPLKGGVRIFNNIMTDSFSIDRIFEIFDVETKIADKPDAVKFDGLQNDIVFKNVNFAYEKNKMIIEDFNLEVHKGETVALVGNSGGGKSSLVNLIPRFYDVTSGSICVDDINIKDFKLKTLRHKIGIVPQETFLFSGTIYENIKYGQPLTSREDIIKAAEQANAHQFIEKLEFGYDTEIGERGIKLSGGQKQRIAIARAILENPDILILDEATSALDNESEKLVQDALEKLMLGKTTFVIAHRLSTIVNSNKIVVMQEGRIKEVGSHEELLEKKGFYSYLYERNFESNEK